MLCLMSPPVNEYEYIGRRAQCRHTNTVSVHGLVKTFRIKGIRHSWSPALCDTPQPASSSVAHLFLSQYLAN